ncbi:hypothetical protein GB928_024190, partial [Shinella curvata]
IAATIPRVDWQDTVRTWLFIGSFLAFGRCGASTGDPLSVAGFTARRIFQAACASASPCNDEKLRRLLQGIPPVRDIQCIENAADALRSRLTTPKRSAA